jgi:2-C-methyl-D-erythritol 4-phosphate cytidylyltransferase
MHDTSAIVVAGGRGVRVGGTVPKQFRHLGGVPLYHYSVQSLLTAGIEEIVLVVPEEFTVQVEAELEYLRGAVRVTEGGPRRRDSVAAGFSQVGKETSIVLIHDAARPFLPLSVISQVASAARAHGAALAVMPVTDTIKRSEDKRVISSTIDRTCLFLAQTPQGFSRTNLSEIVELETPGIQFTDEAMAAEHIGVAVRLVPGSTFCFKITTEDDLAIAQTVLGMLAQKGTHHADWSWLRHTSTC